MDYNSTTIHLQGTPQKHKPPLKLDTSSLFAHFNEIDRKKSKGGKLSRKEKWLWNYESNVRKKLATAKGSGEGSTGQNERAHATFSQLPGNSYDFSNKDLWGLRQRIAWTTLKKVMVQAVPSESILRQKI
ncbi:MAG: hypothetical protein LQ352_005389 [Teloschistes flavicans]|nr:MAG: hypothetical protein LQ352_005389 [Teloschistes flavicans]